MNEKGMYAANKLVNYLKNELHGNNRLKYLFDLEEDFISEILESEMFSLGKPSPLTTESGMPYKKIGVEIYTRASLYRLLFVEVDGDNRPSLARISVQSEYDMRPRKLILNKTLADLFMNFNFKEEANRLTVNKLKS